VFFIGLVARVGDKPTTGHEGSHWRGTRPPDARLNQNLVRPKQPGDAAEVAKDRGSGFAERDTYVFDRDGKNNPTHFGAGRLNSYRAVTGAFLPSGQ
jgi:hypothetical protein